MASAPERGVAPNPAPPTLAKVRLRFAKRGRLRFASHRDVARAFERAVRRAAVPVAHSHGFSPHPRLSWVGAAPTGAASEAEYVEIGLTRLVAPEEVAGALNAALPDGVDILDAVASPLGAPALADLIDATRWRLELPGVSREELDGAVRALLATESLLVERVTKSGRKPVDVRAAICHAEVTERSIDLQPGVDGADGQPTGRLCAILTTVVRQTTPAVRPDDVLAALQAVADLRPPVPPMATRLAQGLLDDQGRLADPLGANRV
jgi:radical SAM-linked protein